jgi:hypothetical protein
VNGDPHFLSDSHQIGPVGIVYRHLILVAVLLAKVGASSCQRCGNLVQGGSAFCSRCGAMVGPTDIPPPFPTQVAVHPPISPQSPPRQTTTLQVEPPTVPGSPKGWSLASTLLFVGLGAVVTTLVYDVWALESGQVQSSLGGLIPANAIGLLGVISTSYSILSSYRSGSSLAKTYHDRGVLRRHPLFSARSLLGTGLKVAVGIPLLLLFSAIAAQAIVGIIVGEGISVAEAFIRNPEVAAGFSLVATAGDCLIAVGTYLRVRTRVDNDQPTVLLTKWGRRVGSALDISAQARRLADRMISAPANVASGAARQLAGVAQGAGLPWPPPSPTAVATHASAAAVGAVRKGEDIAHTLVQHVPKPSFLTSTAPSASVMADPPPPPPRELPPPPSPPHSLAAQYPPPPTSSVPAYPRYPASTPVAERYCPTCGTGSARVYAFCQKCGRPLPPPP